MSDVSGGQRSILDYTKREVGDGRFLIRDKIGAGSFGDVFLGINQETGQEVAIKLEGTSSKHPQLRYEMKVLKELQGGIGVAELFHYSVERYYSVLITSLLGASLEDLFNHCRRRFTPACVMLIGEQLIDRIEYMHGRNFIHRDIKPDNFLIGRSGEKDLIYIIDFGLSKKYFYPAKDRHIPDREGKNLTGTPRYASVNNHKGFEQSRRDDIESIGYVLTYFAKGRLPWQGLKAQNKKDKYRRIMMKKEKTSLEDLCSGVPYELYEFLRYAKSLEFMDRPDYEFLRGLFRRAIQSGKYGDPNVITFDWMATMHSPGTNSSNVRPAGRGQDDYNRGAHGLSMVNHRGNAESIQRSVRQGEQANNLQTSTRNRLERRRKSKEKRGHGHDFKINRAPAARSRPPQFH